MKKRKESSSKNKYNLLDVLTTKGTKEISKVISKDSFSMTVTSIGYHPELGVYYGGFNPKTKLPHGFSLLESDAALVRRTKHN